MKTKFRYNRKDKAWYFIGYVYAEKTYVLSNPPTPYNTALYPYSSQMQQWVDAMQKDQDNWIKNQEKPSKNSFFDCIGDLFQ